MVNENYDFIEQIKYEAIHQYNFTLMPQSWISYKKHMTLFWEKIPFSKLSITSIPTKLGIYAFCLEPGISDNLQIRYLMYIGRAKNLRVRFRQYINEETSDKGRKEIRKLISLYKESNHLFFYYAVLDGLGLSLNDVESELIRSFLPPTNKQIPVESKKSKQAFS
ncbi:MAG: GIY-YIG nuclease family protein [bacterium]|nr:GIY-YIG nuclease family protein [bacterium]